MNKDFKDLADSYLRHHAEKRKEDFWAFDGVNRVLGSGDIEAAWDITFLLLNNATTDEALAYVAAGPLEDFVDGYGDRALDRFEQISDSNSRFQFALSGIWLLPESPVLQRWRGLMTKYGFLNGSRRPLSYHDDCW